MRRHVCLIRYNGRNGRGAELALMNRYLDEIRQVSAIQVITSSYGPNGDFADSNFLWGRSRTGMHSFMRNMEECRLASYLTKAAVIPLLSRSKIVQVG